MKVNDWLASMLAESGTMLKGCPVSQVQFTAASPVLVTFTAWETVPWTGARPISSVSGTCRILVTMVYD